MQEINLIKEKWTKKDVKEFQDYLLSFARGEEKREWEKNIVSTNLPCLAILSKDLKDISNQIAKGNFLSLLDLNLNENLQNSLINANLISKIKDFDSFKNYLKRFLQTVDNWASVDTLEFDVKKREKEFLSLANKLLSSSKTFMRRAGVRILFKFLDGKNIQKVFDLISKMFDEKEYYVNMAISWLVCDAFIKQRDITMKQFEKDAFNDFVTNKSILKCRDSFRVSKEDKQMLLKFKR